MIFDEFHERNLNSDLGLALTLHGRELFRDETPLKVLVMSATLDGESVGAMLGDAPILNSHGRQFPVQNVLTLELIRTLPELIRSYENE